MIETTSLAAAIGLDATIGDPRNLPHPVQAIARCARWCEDRLRSPGRSPSLERYAGIAAWFIVTGGTITATWLLRDCIKRSSPYGVAAFDTTLVASTLSFRSLLDHVWNVVRALEMGELGQARMALASIVGRDTDALDIPEICRATIETLAESLCDGIVAPLSYAMLAGPIGAMGYKAVNTLDSLFGHIEPPYRYFGWCSARADDLANFVPARCTAFAIIGAAELLQGRGAAALQTFLTDRSQHRSPNAGQCEAAMAGALCVRLGGANSYDGIATFSPHLGSQFSSPQLKDVQRAVRIVICATSLCYGVAFAFAAFMQRRNCGARES